MHRAGAAETVAVCVDSASPTAPLDARLVRAALHTQGVEVRIVPFVGIGRGGEGFPVGKFARMAGSECALIMGFPVDLTHPQLPPKVQATRPYALTGFVLVGRAGARRLTLAGLPRGSEVGIAQLDTYAGLLFTQHPNLVMHVYPDDAQMLADLTKREIVAGLAWQPTLAALQRGRATPLRVEPLTAPHMRWDLVALYLPAARARATLFERGVQALRSAQALDALIRPFDDPVTAESAPVSARIAAVPRVAKARASRRARRRVASRPAAARRLAAMPPAAACGAKPPAIYTGEQAARGAVVYAVQCAACHGPQLQGPSGGYACPPLKGQDFAAPSYDFHVSDIFNFVAQLMPAQTPGSLTHDQAVQVMSFLLQQNGYPAGTRMLTYEIAQRSKIALRYYGK